MEANLMKHCCEDKSEELLALKSRQSNALKIVFFINLLMFFVEFSAGLKAGSAALMGDSLDMLGDAFVYGFSLYALYKSPAMRIRAAQLKGGIMMVFAIIVFLQAGYRVYSGVVPLYETMSIFGAMALIANLICLGILFSHREDDINMKSTWICSRNDIIANLGTLFAAFLVRQSGSFWPDVIIGTIIASLFLISAYSVLKEARLEQPNI